MQALAQTVEELGFTTNGAYRSLNMLHSPLKPLKSSKVAVAMLISFGGMAATLISSVLVARLLGVQGKGVFTLFQVSVASLPALATLGIGQGQIFECVRNPDKLRHFMPNARLISFVAAGSTGLAFVVIGSLLNLGAFASMGALLKTAGVIAVPVLALGIFQRQYFLAIHEYGTSKTMAAVAQLLPLLAYLVLYAFGSVNVGTCVVAFVTTQVICGVAVEVIVRKLEPPKTSVSLGFAIDSVRFGVQQYLSDIAELLMGRLDFFLVGWLLGRGGLGIYSVAVALAEVPSRIPYELGIILFPAFAGGMVNQSRSAAILRKTLLIALGLAAILGAVSAPLTTVLYGTPYADAIPAFRWLLLGTVARSTLYVTWLHTSAKGRPGMGIPIFSAAAAFDTAAVILLVPRFGVVGAAVAAAGSYWVAAIWFLRLFCKHEGCQYRDAILIRWSDVRTLLDSGLLLVKQLTGRQLSDLGKTT